MKLKKKVYLIFPVLIFLFVISAYFYRGFLNDLKSSCNEFVRDSVASITKNWSEKELLLRASPDFTTKTSIHELKRSFALYSERLGSLKSIIDLKGNIKLTLSSKGAVAKANYTVYALYEKARTNLETALTYSDKRWKIESFSVILPPGETKREEAKFVAEKGRGTESRSDEKKHVQTLHDGKDFQIDNFTYTSKDKRDPFFALILSQRKRMIKETEDKSGYDLEELKVVGVLKTEREKYALMEDRQGYGVLFKKGDYINKNLWIVDIADDRIVYGYRLRDEVRTVVVDIPTKR
ncbi:MAG: pilus assembly protein PilP [Desulfobacterota bacterium]|nr:pilus assembly protein PilP [Thermodesulfobacteriota bacterium]MDW8002162.1 pilus assembly protein PilP [Deltaproteobacteria bacterium]